MELAQEKRYTFADILSWDDDTRYELYDGELVALASPATDHQRISRRLVHQFLNYLEGKTCEVFYAPFDVQLFAKENDEPRDIRTVLQPDIVIVCDPEKLKGHCCKGAPDLVIEILSPSTQRRDRRLKHALYRRAGVPEYWVVDPEAQVVLVHQLVDGEYGTPVAYTAKATVSVGVLDDCQIDLSMVFPANSQR